RNEAAPRTSSARPGALGSLEIAARLGDERARSTNTTLPCLANARASATAAEVVPTLWAAPMITTHRAADAARRSPPATRRVEPTPGAAAAAAPPLAGLASAAGGASPALA